jgi:integrase/recombinase XerC/integrase/recombinase XerD
MQMQRIETAEVMAMAPSLDKWVNQFINDQDVKSNSADLYRRTLKQYFKWVALQGISLLETERLHIIQYKADLLKDGKSSLTVGAYITSVRLFYEWAETKKYYPNIAKGVKTPKRAQQFKKRPLTAPESTDLLNHITDPRDLAIVNLCLRTGLRTIEVVRPNVGDIETRGGHIVLNLRSKGRDDKDQFVILTNKAQGPITAYLQTRGIVLGKLKPGQGAEPLFTSNSNNNKGGRMDTRTIRRMVKIYLIGIGLNSHYYTAHSLRHTTAVSILRAGGTLENAQGVLRHSNPATTQIYTATILEEQRLKYASESLIDGQF